MELKVEVISSDGTAKITRAYIPEAKGETAQLTQAEFLRVLKLVSKKTSEPEQEE